MASATIHIKEAVDRLNITVEFDPPMQEVTTPASRAALVALEAMQNHFAYESEEHDQET